MKENCPLVSIIIPVYCGEKYLETLFRNLRELVYENLEFIFIDDCSKDNSLKLLEEFSREMPDCRVIANEKNMGVSYSRNEALKIANGKYLFMLDCDDIFSKEIVTECVSQAEKLCSDAVLYNFADINPDGSIRRYKELSYSRNIYEGTDIKKVVAKSFGTSLPELYAYLTGKRGAKENKEWNGPWKMMYKTSIIRQNNLKFCENLRIGEDTIFTNEYLCFCDKISILRKDLYFLLIHADSTIGQYIGKYKENIDQKVKLYREKLALTKRICKKRNMDISKIWGGECILSSVQLAVLIAGDNELSLKEKVIWLKKYQSDPVIQMIWKKLSFRKLMENFSIKTIPVIMIKLNLLSLVILSVQILNKFGFSIKE
ncbi:MAG: glycosyltransferase family 2 protein [Ruminococcus sp.]|nr:glycosyltransferase family 2 protein [Ruminococcus sp.]